MKATAKNNENNMSNSLSKTIKKTFDAINSGESERKIKLDINSANGSKRTSTVSTPVTSSPLILDQSFVNQQYQEVEGDIDNFDDIDCEELESKLKKHDEGGSSSNYVNDISRFGTFEDLHSGSNLDVNNITTSYSLKSISSLTKYDSINQKSEKKKKHATVNFPNNSPLNNDNNYKSKSIAFGLSSHRNITSFPNNPVSENIFNPKFMLKKKFGKNVNKSTSTLDSYENIERDDIFLSTDSLISSDTHFNNIKIEPFNKGPAIFNNIDNKKRLSESRIEEVYKTRDINKGRPTSFDDNKIRNNLGAIVDLDISSIKKPLCVEPSNSSQPSLNSIESSPTAPCNVYTGAIHNLNTSKKVEVYDDDDEDFDFGDMQEGETLKIDEKLLGSNSTSSRTSFSISSKVQQNSLINDLRSSNKSGSNNNSKENSNNHIEEYGDEDFDLSGLGDQQLKIDEKLLGSNTGNSSFNPKSLFDMKGKSDGTKATDVLPINSKKMPYKTISLSSYLLNNLSDKKKPSGDNSVINKNVEVSSGDDIAFDEFDSQDVKMNVGPGTSRVNNNTLNKLEERKKSFSSVSQNNSDEPPLIEIYGDDDFDFTNMDDQPLKIDEKLINPNRINYNLLDPHCMCEPRNRRNKSGDSKASKNSGKKLPYNTISMNSFHTFISNSKNSSNKELMENSYLADLINNKYENLLSKTKLTSDDTFSFSSDSNSNSFSLNEKSDSVSVSKKDNTSKTVDSNDKSSKRNNKNKKENKETTENKNAPPQASPGKVKSEGKKETVIKEDKGEQKATTDEVSGNEVGNNNNSVYRCDSLKTILFQKFFGIEPTGEMEGDPKNIDDEAYHHLLDEITDIISNGVRSAVTTESPKKTKDIRKILENINQKGIDMRKAAAANHSSVFSSELGAHNSNKKGKSTLKKKKHIQKSSNNRMKGSPNPSSSIRYEMDFVKKNLKFDLQDKGSQNDKKEEKDDTVDDISNEEEAKTPSMPIIDPNTEKTPLASEETVFKPQISSDGTLIPNTFSDIFKQRIVVPTPSKPKKSSEAIYTPSLSKSQYRKLRNLDDYILSDAMIKHINNFRLSSQGNTRSSIDSFFDSLQSQEILDKIFSNNSYLMDNDTNSVIDHLNTELQSNSDLDEDTKFNLNSEISLDSLYRMNSHASHSNSYSPITSDEVKKAFKYIDSIRKANLGIDPTDTILSYRRKNHSWRGYDKEATSKRNHLYYTIMDIINDIKNDIFFNPWHDLNEKLNKAIVENIKWEESIQQFQKHWKSERQTFPELQTEMERWNDEYNEQMNIIEEYNRELKILDRQINLSKQRTKQATLFLVGMIFAEIAILLYIRFFIFTDKVPTNMKNNGIWLPYLKSIVQNIYQYYQR